ncbi:uncharacterized protein UV8b_06845 [Ustilaginoidea virens]|uniref:Uncharacterized protein n=1 Tax=Ustilaginoidea virens TaxID=1159556 RepID=A0A8E5HWN1_USTVR|nr:uncharacterized protein UV8b_06845 [Ustilaginoidea virens]QUC22604.1 hypothetical protein UV8b_06845 [Ustilaginoidea virens]
MTTMQPDQRRASTSKRGGGSGSKLDMARLCATVLGASYWAAGRRRRALACCAVAWTFRDGEPVMGCQTCSGRDSPWFAVVGRRWPSLTVVDRR